MSNIMQNIKIEKVTLNIGVGNEPDKLEKAMVLLEKITNSKPQKTFTKKRIPTWNIRPGLAIGCKVTLRAKKAELMLKKLLYTVNNSLKVSQFDDKGNFSFGIKEYIDIPDVKYEVSLGIIGLEVAVTLQRPGFRIKKRTVKQSNIPSKHQISKQQAIDFIKKEFNINVEENK